MTNKIQNIFVLFIRYDTHPYYYKMFVLQIITIFCDTLNHIEYLHHKTRDMVTYNKNLFLDMFSNFGSEEKSEDQRGDKKRFYN